MMAPLMKTGVWDPAYSLLAALLLGIAFGFVLERAGFGSSRKLVAQFYLTDLSVFKVMFTAIVTAMLGVLLLSRAGILDIGEVPLVGTYIVPEVVGGLILGVGFVIGGYCPGTSAVAVATGKVDGMVYVGGLLAGMLFYGELSPLLEPFVNSTDMGQLTIPQYFNLPVLAVAAAIIVMALGGFYGATVLERKFGKS